MGDIFQVPPPHARPPFLCFLLRFCFSIFIWPAGTYLRPETFAGGKTAAVLMACPKDDGPPGHRALADYNEEPPPPFSELQYYLTLSRPNPALGPRDWRLRRVLFGFELEESMGKTPCDFDALRNRGMSCLS